MYSIVTYHIGTINVNGLASKLLVLELKSWIKSLKFKIYYLKMGNFRLWRAPPVRVKKDCMMIIIMHAWSFAHKQRQRVQENNMIDK